MTSTAVLETVAESSAAGARHVMPGTFEAGDYIDFHDSPFEILAGIQESWRRKSHGEPWSAHKMTELDLEGIVWHSYDPPAALRKAPNVTAQALLDLLTLSIDNVKAEATDLARQKREEEEARSRGSKPGPGEEEPYLPIIIREDKPPTPPNTADAEAEQFDDISKRRAQAILAESRSRSPGLSMFPQLSGKRKLNLRRLFKRSYGAADVEAENARLEALGRTFMATSGAEDSNNTVSWDPSTGQYKRLSAQSKSTTFSKPAEQQIELVECVSCLDDFPTTSVVKVPCHSYCFECFAGLISTSVQNEQQWPPKCCLNEIPLRTILRYAPDGLKSRYNDRSAEWRIPVGERVYCGTPDCGIWVKPDNINQRDREGRCDNGHWTCTLCRGPRHRKQACPQDPELLLMNQLAEEQGWKRCTKCQAMVEHREACRHMTCRCGNQFCYVCGAKWCTCNCTGDMLSRIKSAAVVRQREREQREAQQAAQEAAEAEELRQMLAEIEEFEREEALKAEMLRQEQQRLEEERQQRELEERVRQESIRRRDLELKFNELRDALDQLHELQRVKLEEDQEKSALQLAEEVDQAVKQLEERQTQERADLEAHVEAKMAEKETAFNEDFESRSASEKTMVEEYHGQLKAFWGNKRGAAQEIDKAMAPLRERLSRNYTAWQEWKTKELKAYRERLEERKSIKEEFLYSAKARLADQNEGRETELVKSGVADQKWMQMVILERERLLIQLEIQEVEGDADSLFAGDNSEAGAEGADDAEVSVATAMSLATVSAAAVSS